MISKHAMFHTSLNHKPSSHILIVDWNRFDHVKNYIYTETIPKKNTCNHKYNYVKLLINTLKRLRIFWLRIWNPQRRYFYTPIKWRESSPFGWNRSVQNNIENNHTYTNTIPTLHSENTQKRIENTNMFRLTNIVSLTKKYWNYLPLHLPSYYNSGFKLKTGIVFWPEKDKNSGNLNEQVLLTCIRK